MGTLSYVRFLEGTEKDDKGRTIGCFKLGRKILPPGIHARLHTAYFPTARWFTGRQRCSANYCNGTFRASQ